jgi:ATP-dependent Clp protease adapter protein ClpS
MTNYPIATPTPTATPQNNSTGGEGYKVILFNDEIHSVDQVINQLILALQCPLDIAIDITLRAHSRGKAIVTISDKDEADRIARILRAIALVVSVEHA